MWRACRALIQAVKRTTCTSTPLSLSDQVSVSHVTSTESKAGENTRAEEVSLLSLQRPVVIGLNDESRGKATQNQIVCFITLPVFRSDLPTPFER
jgi:hypothetical protein